MNKTMTFEEMLEVKLQSPVTIEDTEITTLGALAELLPQAVSTLYYQNKITYKECCAAHGIHSLMAVMPTEVTEV